MSTKVFCLYRIGTGVVSKPNLNLLLIVVGLLNTPIPTDHTPIPVTHVSVTFYSLIHMGSMSAFQFHSQLIWQSLYYLIAFQNNTIPKESTLSGGITLKEEPIDKPGRERERERDRHKDRYVFGSLAKLCMRWRKIIFWNDW